jgi:hypothetical protein
MKRASFVSVTPCLLLLLSTIAVPHRAIRGDEPGHSELVGRVESIKWSPTGGSCLIETREASGAQTTTEVYWTDKNPSEPPDRCRRPGCTVG